MVQLWLNDFEDSKWEGQAELWLDPAGNEVDISDCTLVIKSGTLSYTWAYEGDSKMGVFTFHDSGATWMDSWHQPEPVHCNYLTKNRGLFTVEHSYSCPATPDWNWAWCSTLSQRPDGCLVLQMTNCAPWGEDSRAVRMVVQKASSDV